MAIAEGRVVCEACGTIDDPTTTLVQELAENLETAKDDLITKGRRIKKLQRERSHALEADKRYGDAVITLEYWRDVCAPRAREPLAEARLKAVLERLKAGYGVVELMRAADGYARFPFYVRGRRCAFGLELDRMVEAEFIYRNAANVDRGLLMLEAPPGAGTQPSPAFIARVPWDRVWHENRRMITAALTRRFGASIESGYDDGARKWPCPFCQLENPAPEGAEPCTLWVEATVGAQIAHCSACGLTDAKLLAAITGDQ